MFFMVQPQKQVTQDIIQDIPQAALSRQAGSLIRHLHDTRFGLSKAIKKDS